MDFTIITYYQLITWLKNMHYLFKPFGEFINNPEPNSIILRHDVDLLPFNSLRFAVIQAQLGIKGSYYFRAVSESWDESVIKEIASLGHEVGYHYETMDTAFAKFKVKSKKYKVRSNTKEYDELLDLAYDDFCRNLETFRKLYPVTTICMHGSPKSKFDNKAIWDKYDYKSLGIIGEPYFDVNYDEVFYLTDTGRRWDGWKYSVRDKLPQQEKWVKGGLVFHSTQDIIKAIEDKNFPKQAMFTFHPQRWHDKPLPWLKEFVWQNTKNLIKYFIIKAKHYKGHL